MGRGTAQRHQGSLPEETVQAEVNEVRRESRDSGARVGHGGAQGPGRWCGWHAVGGGQQGQVPGPAGKQGEARLRAGF